MADKENKRKCFKCNSSPHADNIKLFRFPKPATRNLLRCALWAQYIFPTNNYSSFEHQMKLHTEHRMLCAKHFHDEDFTDSTKTKLLRTAFPRDDTDCAAQTPVFSGECPAKCKTPLSDSGNLQTKTTTAQVPSCSNASTEKEKLLSSKCQKYINKICQLQQRVKELKRKNMLSELEKLSKKLTPSFAILLQAQIRNFNKKKSTGRRWSKDEKIIALRLFKRSPACYRLLQKLFNLPAPSTLKNMLSKVSMGVGANQPVFEVLKKFVETQIPSDNEYILMFDEMSIKKHLNYNRKEDLIEGYQDHGSQERSRVLAEYALVFMIAGIRKKIKQPIAHYFSSQYVTADRLAVLIKEVLQKCFQSGIHISAMVCDMDAVNRRAFTILGATQKQPYITRDNKQIVAIFDPPHLLKCFRNLFMKYDIECNTEISSDGKIGKGIAKWSHVKEFYEIDNSNPNFVFAPALRKDHLNPNTNQKMKVKLAAQVFSHSVAAGMYAKISAGELTPHASITASVIAKIDKLFDGLNSDSSNLRRGKPHATNLTKSSPHLKFFKEMKTFFSSIKFIGSEYTPPSQKGWIWTLNAIECLWTNLVKAHQIRSLATRRLQQDPIENLFGCIRFNCGSNSNPTVGQFVAGLKTAVLSNLSHMGTTGNCETDSLVVIDKFDTLLSAPQLTSECNPSVHTGSEVQLFNELNKINIVQALNEENAEVQACAYVCGFILKKMLPKCKLCRKVFLANTVEKHHLFVECKEYTQFKQSLNYVSKDMVVLVEYCASIINIFLQEKGHTNDLKKNIVNSIKENVNFDMLNKCGEHKEQNLKNITDSVFYICIKRFCTIQNRAFAEERSASALKKKMRILQHK